MRMTKFALMVLLLIGMIAVSAIAGDLIYINTDDPEELDKLPRIGRGRAATIIEYRNEHGNFKTYKDLLAIPGVGPKTVAGFKGLIKFKEHEEESDSRVKKYIVPTDFNTADSAGLTKLPGVGPTMAVRIIKYREKHGPFEYKEDITKVKGVGKRALELLGPRIDLPKRPLADGEYVKPVYEKAAFKINVNGATPDELQRIPAVGKTVAKRIVRYREEHGAFTRVKDIQKVTGIGGKKYLRIANYIEVGEFQKLDKKLYMPKSHFDRIERKKKEKIRAASVAKELKRYTDIGIRTASIKSASRKYSMPNAASVRLSFLPRNDNKPWPLVANFFTTSDDESDERVKRKFAMLVIATKSLPAGEVLIFDGTADGTSFVEITQNDITDLSKLELKTVLGELVIVRVLGAPEGELESMVLIEDENKGSVNE